MLEALSYDFIRNAVIAGFLAAILCGVLGTFVVVKRLVFVSGGISHAAFGGLGLWSFLGADPLVGALVAALAASFALGFVDRRRLRSHDAAMGVLWAVGMALGMVFLAKTPGYTPDLTTYLFGNILMVSRGDVLLALILVVVALGVVGLLFKEFVAVSFDEVFAAVQGIPVRLILLLLLVMVGMSVVLLIQIVGIVLVIALLTIPPLISLALLRSFQAVLLGSVGVGIAMTLVGLALSYRLDVPSGPAIVLVGAVLLLLTHLLLRLRRRRAPSAAT